MCLLCVSFFYFFLSVGVEFSGEGVSAIFVVCVSLTSLRFCMLFIGKGNL